MTDWDAEALPFFVAQWQERFAGQALPRDVFPLLHSAAEYLRVSGQARQSAALLRREAGMGADRYLGHRLEHARQLALALLEAGEKEEARRMVAYYAARPYLFNDMERLGFFLFHRSMQALEEHDAAGLAHCLEVLARTAAGTCDACLLRVIHQAGGLRALYAAAGPLALSTRLRLAVFRGVSRLAGKGVFAGVIGRGLHVAVSMFTRFRGGNQVWMLPRRAPESVVPSAPRGARDRRPILVTRAMGGIGDILMMTPGIRALARKHPGREIHFALPKAFHPLLAHNPDCVVRDVGAEVLHQEDYAALYNLSECPAARVESATLPNVRKSRIDIFSAAMGIPKKLQNAVGRKPAYHVAEEEKAWAEHFLAQRGLAPEQCLAVQPCAEDSYKNYPHMEALAARLAEKRPVLVFHNQPVQGFEHPRIYKIDNCTLRRSIALLSLCGMLVSVDSAFVHAAAALDKKTVALFGPTDGAVFTKHYPRCAVVHGYAESGCSACWRNQGIQCGKGCTISSFCLSCIHIERVFEIIDW
jgi:ADP-heptose:LPS heptosyltransferase